MRSLKEVGWAGFSVNDALTPLINMGQQLFEPPDVAGWDLGPGWFSSGGMLARMNFAAQLATNQKFALRDLSRGHGEHARRSCSATCSIGSRRRVRAGRLQRAARLRARRRVALDRVSDTQLATKSAGPRPPDRRSPGDYQLV